MKNNLADLESFFSEKKIFYVESENDPTVLVAIDPRFFPERKALHWFDTTKERIKFVDEVLKLEPDYLVFRDKYGIVYTFQKLTLKIFNEKVKEKMVNVKDWKSEEEMENGLRASIKNVY